MADGWRLGHRPGLDQLRGVAVLLVMWAHFHTGPTEAAGTVGVTLFFVLSGFLITRLLIEERDRTGRISMSGFYARRCRRLLPALPVALMVMAFVNWLHGEAAIAPMLLTAVYLGNVVVAPGAFGHMWSLAVEEHFYAVWPWIVRRVSRTRLLRFVIIGAVVSAVARIVVAHWSEHWAYHASPLRADALLIGCGLALVVARVKVPTWATWVGIVLTGPFVLRSLFPTFTSWGATVVAIGSALLVARALNVTRRRTAIEHVGRISYGLYLFHVPVAWMLDSLIGWQAVPAGVVGTFVLAELSWWFLERQWLGGRVGRLSAAPQGQVGPPLPDAGAEAPVVEPKV